MPELPGVTETLQRLDRARRGFADFRGELRFQSYAARSGERVCPLPHDVPEIRDGRPCPACKAVV